MAKTATKKTLMDLNEYLFEALDRITNDDLSGEELDAEIKRTDAVAKVSDVIIKNAETQLKALKYAEEYGYGSGQKVVGGMIEVKEDA